MLGMKIIWGMFFGGGGKCIFLETDFWGENFGNLGKVVEWGK
jgi:hypothetical protein